MRAKPGASVLASAAAGVTELRVGCGRGELEELAKRIPEAAEVVLEDTLVRVRYRVRVLEDALIRDGEARRWAHLVCLCYTTLY